MKKYATQLLLLLTAALARAEIPMDNIQTPIDDLQKIAVELYGQPEDTCTAIIEKNEEKLAESLKRLIAFNYFSEGRTIKLLKIQGPKGYTRVTSVPFKLSPPSFFGMEQKSQESSVLSQGKYPRGNYVWCTFHKQCLGKDHERLSIAFFQTFNDEVENLGVYSQDMAIDETKNNYYHYKLLFAAGMQALSAFTHYLHVPLENSHYNAPETAASLVAFLSTYLLLTPYNFLSGISWDFTEMTQEYIAVVLASESNLHVNPTPLQNMDVTIAWLTYLALGTLHNHSLWFFSDQKVEDLQEWLQEKRNKFITAAFSAEALSVVLQTINYCLALPQIQREAEQRRFVAAISALLRSRLNGGN